MEKVKSVQIHSQTPNVHYCNRQNLLMLDAATGGNRYGQLPSVVAVVYCLSVACCVASEMRGLNVGDDFQNAMRQMRSFH